MKSTTTPKTTPITKKTRIGVKSQNELNLNDFFPELLWWETQDEVTLPVKQETLLTFDFEDF